MEIELKIKLLISGKRYKEIEAELIDHGIDIDDESDLILSENEKYIDKLIVRVTSSNERIVLPIEEIVYIETYGHSVEVHTSEATYQAKERLYKISNLLDPNKFIRISNSAVIAKDKVKRITPTLSMKFILTMADGKKIDVTRSYYYSFKDFFGI